MANNTTVVLRWTVDQAAARQVQNETRKIEDAVLAAGDATKRIGDLAADSVAHMRKLGLSDQSIRQVDRLEDKLEAARARLHDISQAAKEADLNLGKLGEAEPEKRANSVAYQASRYGNYDTQLNTLSSLASRFGGAEIGGGIAAVSDIISAAEAVQSFSKTLPDVAAGAAESVPGLLALSNAAGGIVSPAALLTGGLGAVGLATYGVIKALNDHREAAAEYRKELEAQLDRDEQIRAFLRTATSEDIQARIYEEYAKRKNAEANIAFYEEASNQLNATADEFYNLVSLPVSGEGLIQIQKQLEALFPIEIQPPGGELIVIKDVNQLETNLDAFNANLDDEKKIRGESNDVLKIYNRALTDSATAANDAAAAQEQANQAAEESLQKVLALKNKDTAAQIEEAQRVRDWSAEQVQQRLSDIDIERKAKQDLIKDLKALKGASFDTSAEVQRLQVEIGRLNNETRSLTNTVLPAAESNETATEIEKERSDAIEDATKALEADADKLRDITAKRADMEAANAADLADIAYKRDLTIAREVEDAARKQLEDQRKLYADLADQERDYLQERADLLKDIGDIETDYRKSYDDALKDYQEDEQRRTEDHYRKMADIERDMRKRVRDAAASLDARGVIDAQEQGKEQLDDEKEQYAVEQKYRKDDLKDLLDNLEQERQEKLAAAQEALRDLDQQRQQERQKTLDAYRQAQIDQAAEQATRRQRQLEDWAYEDSQRAAHFAQQLSDLDASETAIEESQRAHYVAVADTVIKPGLTSIADIFTGFINSLTASVPKSIPTTGGAKPSLPTFADGGIAGPGWAMVGERGPESVYFAGTGRVIPSDIALKQSLSPQISMGPMTINLNGDSKAPLDNLRDQTKLEGRIKRVVQREFLAILEGQ